VIHSVESRKKISKSCGYITFELDYEGVKRSPGGEKGVTQLPRLYTFKETEVSLNCSVLSY
jgi:hypothetical protein